MNIKNYLFKILFELTVKLRGESFYQTLEFYKKTQYFSLEDLLELQTKKLIDILGHARSHIPYYRNVIPLGIESLEDLKLLPTLEKDALRNHSSELINTKFGHLQRTKTSGGSTGAPVSIVKNSEALACELAASWRGYSWAGIQVGDRQARFWGVPRNFKEKTRARIIDFICHRIRVTAFGYDETEFKRVLRRLERFNPDYLYGYTSIIEELASYIKKSGIKPKLNLKSIITTSEVLSGPARNTIESAFGQKVFDEYGCGEIGTIAHECEHGRLHINMENCIVEIIDKAGVLVPNGELGEIVVTDLTNHSMPLIRYRVKDYGLISEMPCKCGRNLLVLDKVFGREYDSLINSQGKKFHGEFFLYIAEDAKKSGYAISGIQFVQNDKYSITVNLAPANENPGLMKFITNRIKNDFDSSFDVKYLWLNAISREASGKLRVVKYEAGKI